VRVESVASWDDVMLHSTVCAVHCGLREDPILGISLLWYDQQTFYVQFYYVAASFETGSPSGHMLTYRQQQKAQK
jgi:hypothetical protein